MAHDRIYAALKEALTAGEFAPGDKMTVRSLATAFGTSAMPVREALRRLVADRALLQRENRGVAVPMISVQTLVDLRRVRMAIEGLATEWAAATIGDAELARLDDLQAQMVAMAAARNGTDYLATNKEFHFTIYQSARSAVLMPVIESLWVQAGPYLTIMRTAATIGTGLDHHATIVSALRSGEGQAARRAMEHDIGEAGDVMLRACAGKE
jgi:DNA-binding GntR family transcriptional regulator